MTPPLIHLYDTIINEINLSVVEKELITPPLNGLILPGITRRSILNLALEWNQFKVTEKNITMEQVCRLNSEKRVSNYKSYFYL